MHSIRGTHRGEQKCMAYVEHTEEYRNSHRVLVLRPEEKGPFGVDGGIILKTDFHKTGWDSMDWIHEAQDRDKWQAIINMIMNLQVP
jgi:hypothetical protein